MELKVGQRVRILDAEYCRRNFERFNYLEMAKYCGKVTKIIRITKYGGYCLDISSGKNIHVNGNKGYFWSKRMFRTFR